MMSLQELAYLDCPALDVQVLYTGTSGPNHCSAHAAPGLQSSSSSTLFSPCCSAAATLQRPNPPNILFQPQGPARQSFLHGHLPPRFSSRSRILVHFPSQV